MTITDVVADGDVWFTQMICQKNLTHGENEKFLTEVQSRASAEACDDATIALGVASGWWVTKGMFVCPPCLKELMREP